jgi:hypothetical protein
MDRLFYLGMQHAKIANQMSRITDPSKIIFAVTMHDVLSAISLRMGQVDLTLSAENLGRAKAEVVTAIKHDLFLLNVE